MRKRSSNEIMENKKTKQNTSQESDCLPETIPLNDTNFNEREEQIKPQKMADANLDDTLGTALLKTLNRLDIREKLADTFAVRCTSLINETLKKTDELKR